MHRVVAVVVVVPALAACGSAPSKPAAPVGARTGADELTVPVAGAATFARVRSVDAYCTALARRPRKPVALADVTPVEPGYSGDLGADADAPAPGCVTDHPAWLDDDQPDRMPAWAEVGPFADARLVSITTERGEPGCAFAVRLRDDWFVSEDAVADCYDPERTYEDVTGELRLDGRRVVIATSAGHDPCGCDEDLWVGREQITVCGVGSTGAPECTTPVETQRTGAIDVMRAWSIRDHTLSLSAWVYGRHGGETPPSERHLAELEDGGGPAERFRLTFR